MRTYQIFRQIQPIILVALLAACSVEGDDDLPIDIDETAPVITSGSDISVEENTSGTIYSATANEEVTYSLGTSKDEASFSLVTNTISINGTLDFENPEDADNDNIYLIDLTATDDAGNSSTVEIAVTVTDVDEDGIPVVQSTPTYDVIIQENVVYAEGLSHESINSANADIIPLVLDVYTPDNSIENRPVYVFIHGGGFTGGDKGGSVILNLANFYTSRGWVFMSINYRLAGDNGTTPQEWVDFADTFPTGTDDQVRAIYAAQRDAKAALRWVTANAALYNINTDYLTVGGGSAGAITAIAASVSEPEDFRDELDETQDPTLSSTNPNQTYTVQTIIDHWGSDTPMDILESLYGHQRFDSSDPALFIAHGTEDPTVPFTDAEDLVSIYEANGLPYVFYPLEGLGHGPWNATVNGMRLEELAFDFIVEQQGLIVN